MPKQNFERWTTDELIEYVLAHPMSAPPAFAFYPNHWLGSAHVRVMTNEARGGYLNLLCSAWQDDLCRIPDDPRALAQLSGLGPRWRRVESSIRPCFTPKERHLYSRRLVIIRCESIEIREKRRLASLSRFEEKGGSNEASNDKHMMDQKGGTPARVRAVGEGVGVGEGKKLSGKEGEEDPFFQKFWEAYPRKVGKGKARQCWTKIKRPAETLEKILSALQWQVKSDQWTRDHGQYIPHPTTYLNQTRWEDEPPKAVPQQEIFAI